MAGLSDADCISKQFEVGQRLYRYEDRKTWLRSWKDEHSYVFDDCTVEIYCQTYILKRVTRCGGWIEYYGAEKFVLHGKGRRFAYPTLKLAWESFLIRKQRRVAYLSNDLAYAKAVLEKARQMSEAGE